MYHEFVKHLWQAGTVSTIAWAYTRSFISKIRYIARATFPGAGQGAIMVPASPSNLQGSSNQTLCVTMPLTSYFFHNYLLYTYIIYSLFSFSVSSTRMLVWGHTFYFFYLLLYPYFWMNGWINEWIHYSDIIETTTVEPLNNCRGGCKYI